MSQAYDFIKGFDDYIKAKKKKEQAASRGALGTAAQSAVRKVSQAGSTVQRSSQTPANEPQMAQWLKDALSQNINKGAFSTQGPQSASSENEKKEERSIADWLREGLESFQSPEKKEKRQTAAKNFGKALLYAIANSEYNDYQEYLELSKEFGVLLDSSDIEGIYALEQKCKQYPEEYQTKYDRYNELFAHFGTEEQKAIREANSLDNHSIQLFQSPEIWDDALELFDDGWDFGDVTRTLLGIGGKTLATAGATVADVGVGAVKGLANTAESLADTIAYRAADIGDFFGADDWAEEARFVADENKIEDAFSDIDAFLDKGSLLGQTGDAVAEGLGQAATMFALGQLGGTAVATGVGFASGAGSGESEARQAGASDEDARNYGLIAGAADSLTELLFGGLGKTSNALGIGKGLSSADDMLAKKLSEKITDTLGKNLVQFGIKSGAEGLEEVLAGFAQAAGKKATYMSESDFWDLVKDEKLLEQFVVGTLTSSIMQAGDLASSTKAGRDFVTGLSADEQTVVDRVYENEVKAREESGEKVTGKAKNKLFDSIVERMKKGFISTDDIEAALSGDTFQKYKDTTEQKNKLQAEYDELYQMKNGDKSDAQRDRQAELKAHLAQLDPGQYRSQLDEEMRRRLKDSYLAESYNERTRRSQAFQADVSQYKNETARKTVQNIIDAGVANNTNRFREFVDFIAKISGDKGIVFSVADAKKLKETGYAIDDGTVNGYYDDSGITVNISSSKALNSIVGHELTHALEGTEFYETLKDTVLKYAKNKGDYDSLSAAFRRIYQGKKGYETDFESKLEREIVADLIGDYVFTDADFVGSLSTQHRNVFQKLYDEIKYLVKVATAGSKEGRELEKVKKLFDEAYRNTKNTAQPDGVKYDVGSEKVIDLSKDNVLLERLSGVYGAKRYKEIQNYILETLSEQPIKLSDGKEAVVDRRDALHIANKAADKKTAEISHIKDLVENAELYAEDKNAEHNKFDYFCYYVADVRFDNETFPIYLNVGLGKFDRKYHLYDITNRIRDTADRINGLERPGGYALTNGVSKNIIDSDSKNVNGKLSISENGREVPYSGDNVYGSDVALESREGDVPADNRPKVDYSHPFPTQEDIEAMRLEAEEKANQQPVDPIENLYRGLEEIRTGNTQQAEDGIAMLIRGLEEIRNKTAQESAAAENRAKAETIVGNRDEIISQKAGSMYEELENRKKGVRYSDLLRRIHAEGFEWSSIEDALFNVWDSPSKTVSPDSKVEAFVRKAVNEDYDEDIAEWAELFVAPDFEEPSNVIEENQAIRYKLVNNLYSAVQERNNTPVDQRSNADYVINDLKAKIQRMQTKRFKTAEQRRFKNDRYFEWAEDLLGDTSTWKDKKIGYGYQLNTLRRNLRAIVKDAKGNPDYKKADAIYEALQGAYNRHEAERNRELANLRGKYAKLKITKAEDAYIQMLGEFRHNPSTTLTEDVMKEYYEKHKKNINTAKVDQIIEMARKDYDNLLELVNMALREEGLTEIPYRKGYFPHFTNDKQSWVGKLLNWKTKNDDIPTDIAGLTEQFEPVRSYQSFNKQRTTDTTDYSFTKGFDAYSFGALDWIYHIEDIRKRRAVENYIRYIHSDAGFKQKVAEIRANQEYDADEAQAQIELLKAKKDAPLNNFVIDLRRGTQTLAGKKSSLDRETEYKTNRRIYSIMTNISNRVSANMVAGSIRAAMTNFIPITQSWGTVGIRRSIHAMAKVMKDSIRDDDGLILKSAFLTNRLAQAENLYKTGWDKFSDKASWLMNVVDSFTSQTVWRSKYDENIAHGMSESEAILDADRFAEGLMAGRSRGSMPTIFDAKNPITKMLTAFQLEVANQYGYLFQDMRLEEKNKNKGRLMTGYAKVFVGAYVYNSLLQALTGGTAAFDPFRIIEELIKDIDAANDEEDDELNLSEPLNNLVENILQEVPFIGGLLGGGRVPISAALPYDNIVETFKGSGKDIEDYFNSTDKDLSWFPRLFSGDAKYVKNLANEWLNPLIYIGSPMAGGHVKKTIEGVSMFLGNKPVDGSYTTDGSLRYPVEANVQNIAQAALFGKWANSNARDYIEQGRRPLTEEQTEEFLELDIPIQDYWAIRDGINAKEKLSEKAEFIAGLDLSTEQKNLLLNNIADRKEDIDLTDFEKFGNWEEFDFFCKNREKYQWLEDHGLSYLQYKQNKEEYDFAYSSPEKYEFLQDMGVSYRSYQRNKEEYDFAYDRPEDYAELMEEYEQRLPYLNRLGTFDERASYIEKLDLTSQEKNILINRIFDIDKPLNISKLGKYGSADEFLLAERTPAKYRFLQNQGVSYDEYVANQDEYDWAYENTEKYDFLKDNGISYKEYQAMYREERSNWNWAFENQEKYLLSQVVTDDLSRYRKYTDTLYTIRADKDENGKSISGSAKKKKQAYINSLPLSKEEKMILFKMEYPSYDEDNRAIINYIIDLKGYTKAEKTLMLEELGFTVKDGKVSWN